MSKIRSVIIGTGSYVPENVIKNEAFLNHSFYEKNGTKIEKDNREIIEKFQSITEIEERRYTSPNQSTSDIAYLAAMDALNSSGVIAEELDYIIVAHNFGDIHEGKNRVDFLPAIASRVKHKLQIQNPDCIAYDLPFGCPGWVQGIIQADYFIRSGDAKKVLVIGADTLSKITDPHDRDSMIFADGAGATILSAEEGTERGILSHKTQSHTFEEAYYLKMGPSDKTENEHPEDLYIKMEGRKVYEYALKNVPLVMKSALDKSNVDVKDIKKVLVHQANGKMDEAILKRFLRQYQIKDVDHSVMPMTIAKFGNTSVASIPTMLDFILKKKLGSHTINEGDAVLFTSVGAGMNINTIVYRF
ncbi:3-oxoacyl-ACP synthase III family protein [Pseudopedobacter beijingensis]|uniref:3-oxoacyl-ACP synthase III family protein n=1 Tax=Pseudopedobacter beijingensis TaxID=1207056 RepID=A0ABW4ICG0_9SPHI